MQCANEHDNPVGAKFCMTCGEALTSTRPDGGGQAASAPDGSVPAVENLGERGAPSDHEPAPTGDGARRARWPIAVAVVIAVVAGLVAVVLMRPSTQDRYLAALEEAGLADEFSTVPAAVRNAEDMCTSIEDGDEPLGSEADLVGVVHYCPKWEEDFQVLRIATIDGEFRLTDADGYGSAAIGCEGEGGYGDINASTSWIVTNLDGDTLTRGSLGPGAEEGGECVFTWTFEITEGEEAYIVAVGDRGEIDYTFEELTRFGLELSLGD